MRRLPVVISMCLLFSAVGCQWSSKYALDDPYYAEKYDVPYEKDEKIERMTKQMIDARHVEGQSGWYMGAGAGYDGDALVGGEVGFFAYPESWMSARIGLTGLAATAADDTFLGGNIGVRVAPPSRLSPFVGIGGFAGYSRQEDQCDCDEGIDTGLAAVYPEAGLNFWINGSMRLTAGAQYWVSSEGRDADLWYYALSLSVLTR